jgi:hypothetical protein
MIYQQDRVSRVVRGTRMSAPGALDGVERSRRATVALSDR